MSARSEATHNELACNLGIMAISSKMFHVRVSFDQSVADLRVLAYPINFLKWAYGLMSVSLDQTVCLGLADFCPVESGDCPVDQTEDAEKYHSAFVLKQDGAYSSPSRLTGSSSIAQCLHNSPVSMKRSFSFSRRFLSSRRKRSSKNNLACNLLDTC